MAPQQLDRFEQRHEEVPKGIDRLWQRYPKGNESVGENVWDNFGGKCSRRRRHEGEENAPLSPPSP